MTTLAKIEIRFEHFNNEYEADIYLKNATARYYGCDDLEALMDIVKAVLLKSRSI